MRVKNFTRWGGLALVLMLLVMSGFVLAPSRALADDSVSSWAELKGKLPTEKNADPVTISLSGDIVAPANAEGFDIPFRDDVTINLNGHTIDRHLDEPKANGYVFSTKGTLTLVGPGAITGGKSTGDVGGVDVVKSAGVLALTNGAVVTGNVGTKVGGVNVQVGCTVNLSGTSEVYGNTTIAEEGIDIFLAKGTTNALIKVEDTLTGEHQMRVLNDGFPDTTNVLTTGYATHNANDPLPTAHFTLAREVAGYEIAFAKSPARELVSHKHNWKFTEKGNVLEANCNDKTAAACDCSGNPATLTIDASACTKKFDGSPCAQATLTASTSWQVYNLGIPGILYTGVGSTKYAASVNPPTKIGTYRAYASYEVKGKASVIGANFEIKPGEVTMYRMYNPNSGEHFYTASARERDVLIGVGWNYEGIGWRAPEASKTPVYRLYNPNAGDHHYTPSIEERNALLAVGWNYEGVGWYSDDAKGTPLYRQYNPNAVTGTHNYTTSAFEAKSLVAAGWRDEGIGWYGV